MTHADRLDDLAAACKTSLADTFKAGASALRERDELRAERDAKHADNEDLWRQIKAARARSVELATENAELRARLEDARWLAVYYATNGITPLEGPVRKCVSRILAHSAPVERSTLDVIGRIGSDGYRTIDLRDKAPAPASMFDSCACHGHMAGDVMHGPFNCIEQAPAQATCPECGGTGELLGKDEWYLPCPRCKAGAR